MQCKALDFDGAKLVLTSDLCLRCLARGITGANQSTTQHSFKQLWWNWANKTQPFTMEFHTNLF